MVNLRQFGSLIALESNTDSSLSSGRSTTADENFVDVRYGSDLHRVNRKRRIQILEKSGLR